MTAPQFSFVTEEMNVRIKFRESCRPFAPGILEDAYRCFMCTNMDHLVLNHFILDKGKQPDHEKYKKE